MTPSRLLLAASLLALACSPAGTTADSTATTATAAPAAAPNVMADLMRDVDEVQKKMVDLAKAIPASKYGYRPGAGVRSVNEVLIHVAADNYFMPTALGSTAPEATGIKSDSYETVSAYEKRTFSPDSAVKEMEASFAFLKQAMQAQTPATMGEKKNLFGSEMTQQQVWVMTTTHLHEHLGQMIAYARANNVVPPWSR